MVPCVNTGEISATCVPSPVCRGFVPPVLSVGCDPSDSVCKNWAVNEMFDSLKPTVCELARLLPTTSIWVSAAVNPVKAVESRRG